KSERREAPLRIGAGPRFLPARPASRAQRRFDQSFNAPFGHFSTQFRQSMHSVAFFRAREPSRTSTSIGQTRAHAPQSVHIAASTRTRISEKRLAGFKNAVTGQRYL